MELHELPDLSDWRLIEVWTVEESALLWAGIDPMDHPQVRMVDLRKIVSAVQFKKASTFQRAIAEAICGGTLPFVEAWEEVSDYQNSYDKEVEFPDLPDHSRIIPYMTRLNQAAFIKWAQSKKMWSFRQQVLATAKQVGKALYIEDSATIIDIPTNVSVLTLAQPAYMDREHPCSPDELVAASEAWEAVTKNGPPKSNGKANRAAIRQYLDSHPEYKFFAEAAKERICTVSNWDKKGGATPTPKIRRNTN